MNAVESKLQQARKELLDLGLRNKLINHKTLRRSGLDIVDEKPSEVFRILVTDGSRMTFLHNPAAENADVNDDDLVFEQPENDDLDESGRAARHTDTKLQTSYAPSLLQRRLLNTYYAARTAIEEQGVNTLFLALGMLCWYEDESSDILRRAPLVLVPVSLSRASVESKFNLEYSGDEIGPNLSLREKLKSEFAIELPLFDEIDENGVIPYLSEVEKAIKSQARWRVERDAISLGFFAFAKFLMFKDLDNEGWDEGSQPHKHETLEALLGDGFPAVDSLGDGAFLDESIDPADVHFVVDADSSQAQALLEIRGGHHQVIQGPPGTGKSQTITNIIADALGRGQKVLFVAEKMAALEVVKRRLTAIGIGEACLELHSNKTNKRQFLEDLQATLALRKPVAGDGEELLEDLIRSRDQLNQYCESVNQPIGKSGISPIVAFGKLLNLAQSLGELEDKPKIELPESEKWTGKRFRQLVALCREVQAHLEKMGVPERHPFWGSNLKLYQPALGQKISAEAKDTLERIDHLRDCLAKAVSSVGLANYDIPTDRKRAVLAAKLLSTCPIVDTLHTEASEWQNVPTLRQALELGRERTSLLADLSASFVNGFWEKDVVLHRAAVLNYGDKWWRVFVSDFRNAKKFAVGHQKTQSKVSPETLLSTFDSILRYQELEKEHANRIKRFEAISDEPFPETVDAWDHLTDLVEWGAELTSRTSHATLRSAIVEEALKTDPPIRKKRYDELVSALETTENALKACYEIAEIEEDHRTTVVDLDLAGTSHRLSQWRDAPADAQDIVVLNHQFDQLREMDADAVCTLAATWPSASSFLVHLIQDAWYSRLVERALQERSELSVFSSARHEEVIRRFRQKDLELFDHNKRILALKHYTDLPRSTGTGGQMAILRREFEKKRRHLPIRSLMINCGNAIQAIKPVFMMSPLSVATYLPPGSTEFDLVIFDEASQVKPVDAFGALVRAKQAVVVGDSRQLPPTSFFDSNVDLDNEEIEETEVAAGDMESILSLFAAQGAPERMLRWHYRSRHDSLIAISNLEFYDNRLFIFPSPHVNSGDLGLRYHYLSHTKYERGSRKAFNRGEAKAVAKAVMAHAATTPDLTLGVAAFSMAQMRVIQDEIELLRRENPFYEAFFNDHPDEPFFVKNLENVQGDERDVIFISIGYGKDENGYVTMNFGPLNRDGGERRLNVLITRARMRCEIFTNITADDIDLNRTQAVGVKSLKSYLRYAKDDIIDVPTVTGDEADSDFELAVAESIMAAGYKVNLQVGSAGFKIDIGVIDPDQPGRYLVGVECDGATYHSARWARDRDRIRQSVLEGLGWTIHRVWSTDWFRSPQKELEKILETIEAAKSSPGADTVSSNDGKFELEREEKPEDTSESLELADYHFAEVELSLWGRDLHEIAAPALAKAIVQVVDVEGPVHVEEVLRRMRESVGVKRAGKRIRETFDRAVIVSVSHLGVQQRGEFLWPKREIELVPRDRSEFPSQAMKMEFIAPAEIQECIAQCVEHSLGISPSDIPTEVRALFGFKRTTQQMEEVISEQLAALLSNGRVVERGGHIFLASD